MEKKKMTKGWTEYWERDENFEEQPAYRNEKANQVVFMESGEDFIVYVEDTETGEVRELFSDTDEDNAKYKMRHYLRRNPEGIKNDKR